MRRQDLAEEEHVERGLVVADEDGGARAQVRRAGEDLEPGAGEEGHGVLEGAGGGPLGGAVRGEDEEGEGGEDAVGGAEEDGEVGGQQAVEEGGERVRGEEGEREEEHAEGEVEGEELQEEGEQDVHRGEGEVRARKVERAVEGEASLGRSGEAGGCEADGGAGCYHRWIMVDAACVPWVIAVKLSPLAGGR